VSRILLVDDDHDVGEVFAEVLRMQGHDVQTAGTGDAGLQTLRAAPLPDLVILDVDMPVMSGPEMAHHMLMHNAGEERVPVVLVSSRHDLSLIAGRMGTPYFRQKSGDMDGFLRLIERALSERVAPSFA
jgi:CheY-like chemotaxis protein